MVVIAGDTLFEVVPSTEPTELLIDKAVGAPPESVQDNPEDWPAVMVAGVAINVEITGALGLTMTLTDLATIP